RDEPWRLRTDGAELAGEHELVTLDPVLAQRRPPGPDAQRDVAVRRGLGRDLGAAAHDLLGGPERPGAIDREARPVPPQPPDADGDVEVPAAVAPPPQRAQAARAELRRPPGPGDVEGAAARPDRGIAALHVARADADARDAHAHALQPPPGPQRDERHALRPARRGPDALDEQ